MEAVWLWILLGAIVIAVVVWAVIGRGVRARASAAGRAAGVSIEDRIAASTAKGVDRDAAVLGARLRFPDASQGRAVVDQAMSATKAATPTGDGRWSIAHGMPDMVTAVWLVDADGAGWFLAERARQSFGSFVQTRTWSTAIERIRATAAAEDAAVEVHPSVLVPSAETVDGDPIWVAAP